MPSKRQRLSFDFENLRIIPAPLFEEYISNTVLFMNLGNEKFGEIMTRKKGRGHLSKYKWKKLFSKPFVLHHSWKPGLIQISKREMQTCLQLIQNGNSTRQSSKQEALWQKIQEVGWADGSDLDVEQLADKSLTTFVAIQNAYEFTKFLHFVNKQKPKVIVEIGTARGGVLYAMTQLADRNATLISIDLPGAPNCGGQTENERKLFSTFASTGQKLHFIPNNSQFHTTRESLRAILKGRKVDLLFIDGDHSYGGVASDFRMYKEFVAKDGSVAFHDICMFPDEMGDGNEVGVFWKEVSKLYKNRKIVDPKGVCKAIVPKGQNMAFGIGIIDLASAKKK